MFHMDSQERTIGVNKLYPVVQIIAVQNEKQKEQNK